VDPDDSIRHALSRWIGRQPGAALAGMAPHAAAALADERLATSDVVLFNRFLPDASSEEFRVRLKSVAPNAHAFAVGTYSESDDIFKSVSGVPEGYYLRRRPPGSWLEPIEGSQGGRTPTGSELTRHLRGYFAKLINGETRDPAVEGIRFTGREQQILHCLQKGMPDKEIAQELGMSPLTVHTHLKHIFEKLGAHTRTEAVMKFLQK
jgi:DNA-binding NarL/FixJ family response regulator